MKTKRHSKKQILCILLDAENTRLKKLVITQDLEIEAQMGYRPVRNK